MSNGKFKFVQINIKHLLYMKTEKTRGQKKQQIKIKYNLSIAWRLNHRLCGKNYNKDL